MTDFSVFSRAVHARYEELSKSELFVVDVADIFASYLAAFPEGSNPIFRERTEHDCNCCKQFVRRLGCLVAIVDGVVQTMWDVDAPEPYATVAAAVDAIVRQAPIRTVFRTKERQYGVEYNYDTATDRRWDHFHGRVSDRHYAAMPETKRGEREAIAQVLRRGLEEIKASDLETVLDLIDSNGLYRGGEQREALAGFRQLQAAYDGTELFVWSNLDNRNARFRNTVIGTLLTDLSEHGDIERAVKAFETKVAPQNYKRPTALITQRMVDDAVKTLAELGLEEAVERRYAIISDVSVNDVLFVDNAVRGAMQGGVTGLLAGAVKSAPVNVKSAQDIDVSSFVDDVLPHASSVSVLVQNKHMGNFVSLTAPVHSDTGRLFKWGNDFAWSYDGEVADSIKARVKAAGGNVDAKLRVSLAWFNTDDLDIHARCPDGEVYFGNKMGILDVDMNIQGDRRDAVENLSWTRPSNGKYDIFVHNYTKRENIDVGFSIEFANSGKLEQYSRSAAVPSNARVPVMTFSVRDGVAVDVKLADGITGGTVSQDKWGVKTETLAPVDTVMFSPNHWEGAGEVGNRHLFFMLKDARNPDATRGIYNEYLRGDLERHRKVFEVLGSKTKCQPSDKQLSGVGFTQGRGDEVVVVVDKRAYNVKF